MFLVDETLQGGGLEILIANIVDHNDRSLD
jgi:hypothetical protein